MQRPDWDTYFLEIAELTAKRSNCCRRKVGAVVTKNNRLVSTGYNGTPHSIPNCFDGGCTRCNDSTIPSGTRLDECVCLHAEENAILHSRENLEEGKLYCTHKPCLGCLKRIIQVGIKEVHYTKDYIYTDTNQEIYNFLVNSSRLNLKTKLKT